MRGVPLRIELGPRDIENGQVVLATRLGEKRIVKQEDLLREVEQALEDVQRQMYERALAFMKEHTYSVDTLDELKQLFEAKRGFVLAGWCGSEACEHQVKLETKATSRNIPFIVDEHKSKCLVCEEQAKHTVVFARAY
jgi:prolyl-tRNA synthetase